jgi:predicted membrane protein
MGSFRSGHYPRNTNAFVITQEYAMRYYFVLMFIAMLGAVIRTYKQKEMLIFTIIAGALVLLLGNMMAHVRLRRDIAEIFFVNDGFSIISVHDILHKSPKRSFPLKWANPTRTQDEIQFHFEDQIMTLKREDWGSEFDLIWNWFLSGSLEMGAPAGMEAFE